MLRKVLLFFGVIVGVWLLNFVIGYFAINFAAAKQQKVAYILDGISRASEIKIRVSEYFQDTGKFPASNMELGLGAPESFERNRVKRATVGPNGEIRIDYSGAGLDDASIILRPAPNTSGAGPSVRWDCFAVDIDASVTALIPGAHCAELDSRGAIPAPPSTAATIDDLISAIHARRESLVRHLLVAGVNANGVGSNHELPLFAAIDSGNSTILELLIRAGADSNRRAKAGGPTPLMMAAQNKRNFNMIHVLTSHGAELEARDAQGMTALMYAARAGNGNNVEELLRAGADFHAVDSGGNKAINYAAVHGDRSAVYLALERRVQKQRQGEDFIYRLPEDD